jgi:cysteine synthase A
VARLAHLAGQGCAEVWVKMEAANPTGSYKDRMAVAMIEAAEADGRLRPGQLVVEYTGGSTGSSLAFVCAVKGYPLRIVSSDAFADEKIRTMRAFGAEVELIPSPDGITPELIPAMMRRAAEITAQTGAFATDQFNNTDMVQGYRRLGEELLDQLPGQLPDTAPVSAFCSYVGTAGCFLGASRALTAAHRTLPLGTQIKVTNLENGKSVRVRINDRGPHVRGRIVDLSAGAAAALGFSTGVVQVRIEILSHAARGDRNASRPR